MTKTKLTKRKAGRSAFAAVLSLFFLLAAAPCASAQDETVILPTREVTRRQSLEEIEQQTHYRVGINWGNLDPERKVMMPASRMPVKEILSRSLEGTDHTWKIEGNQIVVSRFTVEDDDGSRAQSAMHREGINPSQMVEVRDPYSKTSMTPEEIAGVRSGLWYDEDKGSDSIGLAVLNFRVNRSLLEREYMSNDRTLDLIHHTFSNKEALAAMDFIVITSASSPEGNTPFNKKLAADRALAVKSYLMWRYPFLDRERVFTFSIGEDWSGLRKMVEDDPATPRRREILDVIDSEASNDAKRARLKAMDGGAVYKYLSRNMLPHLRGAAACMIYYKPEPQPIVIRETILERDTVYVERLVEIEKAVVIEKETEPVVAEQTAGRNGRYYMAAKTNLLYDALLLPDLALEFSLPRRWSIEVGGQWSWWQTGDPKYYSHRVQFAGIEVRKWLGRRDRTPLTGHFLGLYGMGGNYDLKFGKTGQLCDDLSWSAGITYGYSMPVGQRLNLEFSLGFGYLWGEYDTYEWYEPHQCYNWQASYKRNYIGPTKAEITLVWLIGSGKNPKKQK